MTICLLTHTLDEHTGWGRYAAILKRGLEARGHSVVVPQLPNPLRCVANPLILWRARKDLRESIDEHKPDVVHVVVEPYGALIGPYKGRVVLSVHGTYAVPENTQRGLQKILARIFMSYTYKKADIVIAVSDYTKSIATKSYEHIRSKILVIPNGIEVPEFTPKAVTKKQILYVGEVKPRKGLDLLFNALEEYSHPWSLVVVGSYNEKDSYYKSLARRAEDMKEKVSFLGPVDDNRLDVLYRESGVFCMLSVPVGGLEGFGLVYLEAAARGLPSIGSKYSGAVSAIKEGSSGYVVDPYDSAAVRKALEKLLEQKLISPESCYEWAMACNADQFVGRVLEQYYS